MIGLRIEEVLKLHQSMIAATGGVEGVRDKAILESAIYHAFATFDGLDLYPTLEEKAARQAYAIIRNHPFVDGNKRTGLFVMLIFLELNGQKLMFNQQELVSLGIAVADGSLSDQGVLKWVQDHCQGSTRCKSK